MNDVDARLIAATLLRQVRDRLQREYELLHDALGPYRQHIDNGKQGPIKHRPSYQLLSGIKETIAQLDAQIETLDKRT